MDELLRTLQGRFGEVVKVDSAAESSAQDCQVTAALEMRIKLGTISLQSNG